ncbi:site-2 protease family protein [Duganella guangzhouensis]|nr:site-2 protease family protein [Duganella guangzhouensis]
MPLLILVSAVFIHLAAIALMGKMIGVKLHVFSLGVGPAILTLGRFRLSAIPTGGYVRFRDSTQDIVPPGEMNTALDGRTTLEQLVVALSGCVVLFALGLVLAGADGLHAFLCLPQQLFSGVISPFERAPALINSSLAFMRLAPHGILAGTVCAKLAALNLLPLPGMNGGAALRIIGIRIGAAKWWPDAATRALTLVYVALLLGWCLALIVFLLA